MNFGRRARRDNTTPLAPLLDVVLLLLIFFVVTTSFAENQLPLELPGAEAGTPGDEDVLVVEIDAAGSITIEGDVVDEGALLEGFTEARAASRPVELRADRASEHGVVVRVLDLANEVGIESVGIAVSSGRPSIESDTPANEAN